MDLIKLDYFQNSKNYGRDIKNIKDINIDMLKNITNTGLNLI